MILGFWITFDSIRLKSNAVATASDLSAFSSRVAAETEGKKYLEYGGEREKENFQDLIMKVNNIDHNLYFGRLGMAVSALSAIGLTLAYRKKVEPAAGGNG